MRRRASTDLADRVQQWFVPVGSAPQRICSSDKIGAGRQRPAGQVFAQLALRHAIGIIPKLDQQTMTPTPPEQIRPRDRLRPLNPFADTPLAKAEPQPIQSL